MFYNNWLMTGASAVYFLLNRLGKRSSYLMASLALIFYLAHTILEFSNGMYLKSPVDLNKSFTESKGTAVYGLKKAADLYVTVISLLSHGCPLQAIVATYELDERTVQAWRVKAGLHCQGVHEHLVEESQLDLGQAGRRIQGCLSQDQRGCLRRTGRATGFLRRR